MNKEQVLCRLRAIVRQLTFMNPREFENSIINGEFKIEFDHMCWGEDAKILTKIEMKKVEICKKTD